MQSIDHGKKRIGSISSYAGRIDADFYPCKE